MGSCLGLPVAPGASMVTVPVQVPALRPVVVTLTLSDWGALPVAGLTASQGWSSLVLKLRVPPPVLVMLSVWVAGLAAPAVPLKVRLVGATVRTGGCGGPAIAAP